MQAIYAARRERLRRAMRARGLDALLVSQAANRFYLSGFELHDPQCNESAGRLEPGRTEKELSWAIERFFRENGAEELAFANIVAGGRNAALPHAIPGEDAVTENCLVLIDVGCRVDAYCSDQTRTFWAGDAPAPEFRRTLALVREAQEAALKKMRPGLSLREVYALARAVFEKAGVAEAFTHGLGHGVGLETHEAPSLSPRAEGVLEPGMVVTVEPGLYYSAWGGVRWEYTVLVEEGGVRIL